MLGELAAIAGPMVLDALMGKAEGVPAAPVGQMDYGQLGDDRRQFMDHAFPGTTPWERLGSSGPEGAVSSAEISARAQSKMQQNELQTRKEVAKMQGLASVISAGTVNGAEGVQSAVKSFLSGGMSAGGRYDTMTSIHKEKLQHEIDNMDADSKVKLEQVGLINAQGKIAKSDAEIADELGDAKLFQTKYGHMGQTTEYLADAVARIREGHDRKIREVAEYVENRGESPSRFKDPR